MPVTAALSGVAVAAAVAATSRSGSSRARLALAGVGSRGAPDGGQLPVALGCGAAACLAGLALLGGWPLPLLLLPAAGAVGAWWAVGSVRLRRRQAMVAAAVPEAAIALAAELRAGAHPAAALTAVAEAVPPLGSVLAEAARQCRSGRSAAEALRRASEAAGVPTLGDLAAAWAAVEQAGVAGSGVLERLGAALDADQEAAGRLRAQLAGPRATAILLAGLPLLGVGLGQAVGADPLALLLGRPLGWALCTGAAVLDVLGLIWTGRIVRGVNGGRPP